MRKNIMNFFAWILILLFALSVCAEMQSINEKATTVASMQPINEKGMIIATCIQEYKGAPFDVREFCLRMFREYKL